MRVYALSYNTPRKHFTLVCRAICPDQIERIQKRALRILDLDLYREALADANLRSLYERREHSCITLFNQISESDSQHKLAALLPARNDTLYSLRNKRMFSLPNIKTKSFRILLECIFQISNKCKQY